MIHYPPSLRYIPIIAIICVLAFGCSPVNIDDAARAKTKQEALLVSGNLAIRPFSPITMPAADTETAQAAVNQIEARLFSIRLKQTLAKSGHWGQVHFISETDHPEAIIVSGRITESTPRIFQIEAVLSSDEHAVRRNRSYDSSAAGGPDERFREIADQMLADLVGPAAQDSPSLPERGLSDNHINAVITAFDAIIIEAIETYWDIYYEDLIERFAGQRQSHNNETDPLIALDEEVRREQLQAVAAVVRAVILRCLPQNAFSPEPLQVLLEDKPFSHYSNFQPIKEYTEAIRQARELGLVFVNENRGGTIATENNAYVLIGSAEEQYRKWRQMIADICIDSR